ncbi:MAG: DUF6916 family protein [Salinarimonas sp.]
MLDQLTYEDFKDETGKTFVLEGTGGRVEMELIGARLSPYPGLPARRRAFAILFITPPTPILDNQMYNIRHPKKGLMEGVFITPVVPAMQDVGKLNGKRVYEAVFN